MPTYLLEHYLPQSAARAHAAALARAVADRDASVRHRYAIYLGEDETCFHVFDAGSQEAVVEAARSVGLHGRVVEAVETRPGGSSGNTASSPGSVERCCS